MTDNMVISVTLYNSSGVFHCDEYWDKQHFDEATARLTPLEKGYLTSKGLSVRLKKGVYIRVKRIHDENMRKSASNTWPSRHRKNY